MLGDKIRQCRKERSLSQEDLATALNVSRQSISLWETSQTLPSLENIAALSKLFGVSADELLSTNTAGAETPYAPSIYVPSPVALSSPQPAPPVVVAPLSYANPVVSPKKNATIWIVLVSILASLALLVLGFFIVQNLTQKSDTLVETPLSAEEIYTKISPSVVEVRAYTTDSQMVGSGFFLDEKGTIVTNYHVIDGRQTAEIVLLNGSVYEVTAVLGYDAERDLAILSTTCDCSSPLSFRETPVNTGESVYTLGSSKGLTGTMSDGIVSAVDRKLGENIYIQTTAPISQGNSGGPLIDDTGNVVGVICAFFVDGQNLNLAIPVADVKTVSLDKEISLADLFSVPTPEVYWISEREFFYYEEYGKFVLVFELADEDEVPIASSGTAKIKIVNDDGVSVYEETRAFSEDDFKEWTYDNTIEKFLASIYINSDDITPGSSSKGTVYLTVYGDTYSFDESTMVAQDLPLAPLQISTPSLPQKVDYLYYDDTVSTTTRIDSITYDVQYDDSLCIHFAGEKTFDRDGENATNFCGFGWKLYDSEGYLLDGGTILVSGLSVGDKFKDEEAYAFNCINPGESYKIVITDYS